MVKSMGKKSLHVQIPVELHDTLAKICIDTGLSATSIITQYLKFLRSRKKKNREILNATTSTKCSFRLDGVDVE